MGQMVFSEAPGNAAMLNTLAGIVIVGAWIWTLNKLASGNAQFYAMLSVFAHATVVLGIGALALGLVASLQPAPIQAEAQYIVKSNVGAFFETGIAAVDSLLRRLDLFILWWLVVLTIGIKTVAKTSTGLAASLTLLPWAVIVLITMAWAAVFG